MEKVKKLFCIFLISCLMLCGCKKTSARETLPPEIVTEISVSYCDRSTRVYRIYNNAEKMDIILHYLYSLNPHGQADMDPEQLIGEQCKILLTLSNGNQRTYRQYGKQYLSVDNRPWQIINKEKANVLYHLLNHIESDR